jgi:hypothetical protein
MPARVMRRHCTTAGCILFFHQFARCSSASDWRRNFLAARLSFCGALSALPPFCVGVLLVILYDGIVTLFGGTVDQLPGVSFVFYGQSSSRAVEHGLVLVRSSKGGSSQRDGYPRQSVQSISGLPFFLVGKPTRSISLQCLVLVCWSGEARRSLCVAEQRRRTPTKMLLENIAVLEMIILSFHFHFHSGQ